MYIFTLFALILSFNTLAFEQNVKCESFEECSYDDNGNAIAFESESTKFGLVTTSFDGRALNYKIEGKLKQKEVSNIIVTLPVGSLSTDLSGRDDKMWNEILKKDKFPEIILSFPPISHGYSGSITCSVSILGKSYDLPVNLSTKFENGELEVLGKGSFSLKEFNIPDPSIAIASVRDRFDFKFKAKIK